MGKNNFSWKEWIGITALIITYAHATFMTVREKDTLEKRLDRIEAKVDQLLEVNQSPPWRLYSEDKTSRNSKSSVQ